MATLNYRGPTTASDLRAKLARMEQSFLARWLLLVLAGAAFCLIGPVLFGTLIWLHQFGERLAEEETGRALAALESLSEAERDVVRQMAERIVRRLLYPASQKIRESL